MNVIMDQQQKLFKLNQYFRPFMNNNLHNTSVSFDSIETPAWTSIVATEQSKQIIQNNINNKPANTNKIHNEILNRLNSLPRIDMQQDFYSKMRINSTLSKNKNIIVYATDKKQSITINQTPRQEHSSKYVNRFSTYKINSLKSDESNFKDSRNRISSIKTEAQISLQDKIKQRISLQNKVKSFDVQDSDRRISLPLKKYSNQITNNKKFDIIQKKSTLQKSYKDIHNPNQMKQNNGDYLNRYLLTKENQKIQKRVSANKIIKKNIKSEQKIQKSRVNRKDQKDDPKIHRRFNSITIYDHLYQDSFKLESKKKMEKMIDQSYNKAAVCTFNPIIGKKSNILATSKFQRQLNPLLNKYESNSNRKASKQSLKQKKIQTNGVANGVQIQQLFSNKQKIKQKIQNRALLSLFKFLSDNEEYIEEIKMQQKIKIFPLSLIQDLKPLISKVYQCEKLNQKIFFDCFSLQKQLKEKRGQIVNMVQRALRKGKQNNEIKINSFSNK